MDPEGRLHVADLDGIYYCITRDGVLAWRVPLAESGDRRVLAAPAVDAAVLGRPVPLPQGKVAVPAINGVYVFRPEFERFLPQVAVGSQGPLGVMTELELVNLGPGEQRAAFLDELFSLPRTERLRSGLVVLESSVPLAVVALSEADSPGIEFPEDVYRLSVRPVLPGVPAGAGPAKALPSSSATPQ